MSTAELEPKAGSCRGTSPSRAWRRRDRGSTRRSSARSGSWRSPSAIGSGLNLAAEPRPGERSLEHARARGRHAACSGFRSASAGSSEDGAAAGLRHSRGGEPRALASRAAARARRPRHRFDRCSRCCCSAGLAIGAADLARPLRRLEQRDRRHRGGPARGPRHGWPRELAGVTGNLNALLVGERKRARTLSHDARQSRAQPQDAARGPAQPARQRRDGPRRARAASSSGCRTSSSTSSSARSSAAAPRR